MRQVILHLYAALVKPYLGCCVQFWLSSVRETWRYWRESSKGPLKWWRDQSIPPMRRGWEIWDCSARRREGLGGSYHCIINTWRERARLFLVVPSNRTGGNGHTLKHRRFTSTPGNTFSLWGQLSTGTDCPEMLWCLHSEDVWAWSLAISCRWPCLSRWVGPDESQKSLPTSTMLLSTKHKVAYFSQSSYLHTGP